MPSMRPSVQRLTDLGVVAAIAAGISVASQSWSGFNSPDSEFYASLALFGSDITDRAFEPAYTWTRLGYIAPVRSLVTVFGPWVGFEVWRCLLITLIVGSIYAAGTITGRSRVLAGSLSIFVGLNTVVLAFVGNTYLTGTAIAVMFALITVSLSFLGSNGSHGRGLLGTPRWSTGVLSGLLAGWLIMINPYAFILGGAIWGGVRITSLVLLRDDRIRRLTIDGVAGLAGAALSVAVFLAAGRSIFPELNWWTTYLEWNSRLDYTVFIIDANTWQRDSALLIVVASVVISLVTVIVYPARRWAWAAITIGATNVAVTAILMISFTGPWLEAPTYIAKLWPASLISLALAFFTIAPGTRESRSSYRIVIVLGAMVTIPALLWSGRFDGTLSRAGAWLLASLMTVLVIGMLFLARRAWNRWVAVALSAAMLVTFVSAQILQNGRGLLGGYGQYPFRSAFVDFNYREQMESKINVQRWLIARTSPDDTIALWTDPQFLTADVAAMQLWGGYNIFTRDAELNRETTMRLEEIRPSVVALYAPDKTQIDTLYETLPPWALPSELECTEQPYLGVGTGQVVACLTRLTWVG